MESDGSSGRAGYELTLPGGETLAMRWGDDPLLSLEVMRKAARPDEPSDSIELLRRALLARDESTAREAMASLGMGDMDPAKVIEASPTSAVPAPLGESESGAGLWRLTFPTRWPASDLELAETGTRLYRQAGGEPEELSSSATFLSIAV